MVLLAPENSACSGQLVISVFAPHSSRVRSSSEAPHDRAASIHFRLAERLLQLSLYWIVGYGGGLFLPFRDATNGDETFGGGRYLYDTIKGADLGAYWETIVLDFNFADNPSCAYNAAWSCPLPPQENRLPVAVEAGEKDWKGQ